MFVQSWRVKTKRKRRQLRLRCFLGRRRVLDRFFDKLKGPDGSAPRIAFGDARFPSSRKGWGRSAPTTSVRGACHRRFPLTADAEIDEFRTSSVCPTCGTQLCGVINPRTNESVRGFRRCPSPECAARAFLSRDALAAINILQCHEAALEARPVPDFFAAALKTGGFAPTRGFSCENAEISKKRMRETVGVVSSASALVIPPFGGKLSQPYFLGWVPLAGGHLRCWGRVRARFHATSCKGCWKDPDGRRF